MPGDIARHGDSGCLQLHVGSLVSGHYRDATRRTRGGTAP